MAEHLCTCLTGRDKLPEEGQRLRITLVKDMQLWQGTKRSIVPAGTAYEGVAAEIDPEGFFDLVDDEGEHRKFYVNDSSIQIEQFVMAD
jgi:hypothetical protein